MAACLPTSDSDGVTRRAVTPFVSVVVEHFATRVPKNRKVGWNYELPWACCEEREYDVRVCFFLPHG